MSTKPKTRENAGVHRGQLCLNPGSSGELGRHIDFYLQDRDRGIPSERGLERFTDAGKRKSVIIFPFSPLGARDLPLFQPLWRTSPTHHLRKP